MRGHLQVVAFFVIGVCQFLSSCNGIRVEEFIGFPFSLEGHEPHLIMPPSDDKSHTVLISPDQPILVNGTYHRSVHINTNGALTFTKPSELHEPRRLPFHGGEYLAVFWTDFNPQRCKQQSINNHILYKEYQRDHSSSDSESNLATFRQIDAMVAPVARCANISFATSWAFVVTWKQVAYFNSYDCDKYAEFQVVLATDGRITFALMNYANVDAMNTRLALVGVNAGDGINSHMHPSSLTDNIYSIDDKQGNTGTRGQWVFRIDHINKNTDYSLGSNSGNIHLSPSVGSYFGGTPVLIDGPCIVELNEVKCTFGKQEVPGIIVKDAQYLCVTPDFDEHRAGPVPFSLTLTSHLSDTKIVANSTFHRATRNPGPTKKVRIVSETYPIIQSPGTTTITWMPDFIPLSNSTSYKVDIAIYEVVISNATLRLLDTLATNIPNNGSAEVSLRGYKTQAGLVKIKIMLRTDQPGRGKRQIQDLPTLSGASVSIDAILSTLDPDNHCNHWEEEEADIDGQELLFQTNPCPPTKDIINDGPCRGWFTASITKASDGSELLGTCFQEWKQRMIHPDAFECYEQSVRFATPTGPGNECCYDGNGNLCTELNCGGSIDRFTYSPSAGGDDCLKHYEYDILPAIRASLGEDHLCPSFREKRPTDYRFFGINNKQQGGNGGGDPHIITLDGLHYTFNGKGEFTLVDTPDDRLTLQARMTEFRNDKIGQLSGTVLSAIAAKTLDSDTVQIEITPERKLITLVNGEIVNFEDVSRLQYNKVVVELKSETLISLTFAQLGGTYIEVREESGVISDVAVFLSEDFIGITRGLMGNFNDDTTDDLVAKGSDTPIPSTSSVEVIHNTVGITWIVSNEFDSLFTYHDGESFKDYYYPHYEPVFEPTFSDPVLEKRAEEMCNGDENCLFDVAATGSLTIGLAIKHANEFRNRNRPPPPTCNPPCANDGICMENNTCICQLGWTGLRCSQSDRPAPVVTYRCFFGVLALVQWSVQGYFNVSEYRVTVTEAIGGNQVYQQVLPHPNLSTVLRLKRGVQYVARVEAKISGKHGPAGEETICCSSGCSK